MKQMYKRSTVCKLQIQFDVLTVIEFAQTICLDLTPTVAVVLTALSYQFVYFLKSEIRQTANFQ